VANVETATTRSYVIFRLGAEEYGLPVRSVNSIIRFEDATPVPRSPSAVIGVINLRGRVIPVVDLKKRFGKGEFGPEVASRIVVGDGAAGPVGVAVDAASEVVEIPLEDIKPVPESILTPLTLKSFEGVVDRDGSLVILLDLDEAVPRPDFVDNYDAETREEGDSDV
jgi:purine-binding chemotaxis protein CheW